MKARAAQLLGALTILGCSSSDSPRPEVKTPPRAEPPAPEVEVEVETVAPRCVVAEFDGPLPSATLTDDTGTATATTDGVGCDRSFALGSTAPRRDDRPASPRALPARGSSLQTNNVLFDAVYQLAQEEAAAGSVDAITDGAFNGGAPLPCKCFETGESWTYVWTRDTAYASHLGLSFLDPSRARASLDLKLSPRRDGSRLQIVQDTGTGGSYPVSSDRVVWAMGARDVLLQLTGAERSAFRDRMATALEDTLAQDRALVLDSTDGLYRGEQSFLDWRSQSYPEWTVPDTVHIAMSKSLGTNVGHLAAIEVLAELADDAGDPARAESLRAEADALQKSARRAFWLADEEALSSFLPTTLDPAPARRFDLLGTSLAILHGVVSAEEGRAALSRYPVFAKGPPVIFPEQPDVPIYHNRAIWPFVTAFWAKAARKVDHAEAVTAAVESLLRGAALNLSNMENLEATTGRPWVDDGNLSGPVVNSRRQLWSVAGYVGVVNDVLFGIVPTKDGARVAPYLPRALHASLFAGSRTLAINDVRLRDKTLSVVLRLPETRSSKRAGAYGVGRVRLNGRTMPGGILAETDLRARNIVEVMLTDDGPESQSALRRIADTTDRRTHFAPRTPTVTSVALQGGKLQVAFSIGAEAREEVRVDVYRDGVRVATDVPGGAWVDEATNGETTPSHCYAVETRFATSGNTSYRAKPVCFWGSSGQRITSIDATAFAVNGGVATQAGGRSYYADWGDPSDTIAATFTATHAGPHLIEAVYANGSGPIETGVACAVKRVEVVDTATGVSAGSGYFLMPQRAAWGVWGDSSFVRATLVAGRTYRVQVGSDDVGLNMSELEHFASYAGAGGKDGPMRHVDIAALKVLALSP